jgi:leader peptidase (prepilin peptidase)/N-methyltransferase
LVELGCGLLGALTWLSLYKEPYAIAYFLYYFSILCIFICGFVIDLKHRLIPDPLNILLLTIGLVYGSIKGDWISMPIGALLGYGIPFAVTWVMYKLRGVVGMGGGDLKLFAALGVILGPFGIYLNIILSSLLGSVIVGSFMMLKLHKKDQPFAFGPYIYFVAGFQIFFPNYFQVALQYIGLL